MTAPPDAALFWPLSRLREAVAGLLSGAGLPSLGGELPPVPDQDRLIGHWLHRASRLMGFDARVERPSRAAFLDRLLESRGPTLVLFYAGDSLRVLTYVGEGRSRARVLGPQSDFAVSRLDLYDAYVREASVATDAQRAIFSGLDGGDDVLSALLDVGSLDARPVVLVRYELDAATPLSQQLIQMGAGRALAGYGVVTAIQGAALLGATWTLGSAALDGRVDAGRVLAWAVMSFSDVPLQYLATRALGAFSIALGARLRRRMLEGTFTIEEAAVRSQGFGAIVARVSEAAVIEQTNLAQLVAALLPIGQLVLAATLFWYGPLASIFLPLLGVAVALAAWMIRSLVQHYADSYVRRIELTDDLVEKILGYRTRAVQEPVARRHVDEDPGLAAYAESGARLDRSLSASSSYPRLWLFAAASVLLGAFVSGGATTSFLVPALGVMAAFRAFGGLFQAAEPAAAWLAAYRGVRPLLDAGAARPRPPRAEPADVDEGKLPTVLSVSALSFAHRTGGRPVFAGANLRVASGERVLLTGASGGGKTTLFKLLGGERRPTGGVILVGGSDAFSVSEEEWRRRVASAPQFHENHVFSSSLAFNLDPLGDAQFASDDARAICAELGLDRLIARMPQGYAQLLGDNGWQLSHGERSRLFIARALLQQADLLLFDESFGALDPDTLLAALACVRRRGKTVMVIAHT